ncbi:hypothetical protein RGQ29_002222 [Quercus rubra]|uniref:P-loop containing nucleoside triphosphate hydrolases superfamily protein n=1 Tax=Quercus rubra TaxID=3512 RepID=A0AAN7J898_QUERU|nr:hypothetical protein RGQ29_002222 [Quercus rubra]
MAPSLASPLFLANPISHFRRRAFAVSALAEDGSSSSSSSSSGSAISSQQSTKLVTFLGKGGSGKTTSAVFAAQHYALAGLSTCLVIHSQDPTADYLLNCKIGTSPVICNNNLSAVRLETSKLILEPLNRVKQADAHLNMTQGVLEGIVGEELGVLPGMDSIASAFALERLVGFLSNVDQRNNKKDKFDIIIYDGISNEEILRMIGASSKARLVDEAMNIRGSWSLLNGKMSAEIWDTLEQMLERGSSAFLQPHKFGCFLVMDPNNPISVNSALRYWGCAIQAGAQVSGAFGIAPPHLDEESVERVKQNIFPLPFAFIPQVQVGFPLNWNEIMLNTVGKDAKNLLSPTASHNSNISSVKFDPANKSITLFMPGFDKSEIKLYQYRGGSELLVEAGDQRRVILLPSEIQGKVGGAKFMNRSLVITMR